MDSTRIEHSLDLPKQKKNIWISKSNCVASSSHQVNREHIAILMGRIRTSLVQILRKEVFWLLLSRMCCLFDAVFENPIFFSNCLK